MLGTTVSANGDFPTTPSHADIEIPCPRLELQASAPKPTPRARCAASRWIATSTTANAELDLQGLGPTHEARATEMYARHGSRMAGLGATAPASALPAPGPDALAV
jgi:hypothetical protein